MRKKYKHKKSCECKEISKTNKILTYIMIILAISQILNILYEIVSKLYKSVDKLIRKFIMYVLLELPIALASVYITILGIACFVKIIHLNFIKNRKPLLKQYENNTGKMLIKVAKNNKIELLMIIILPIIIYLSIETLVFAYHFKETQFFLWGAIIGLFSTFSIGMLLCVCGSKTNIPIFHNDYKGIGKKVNMICDKILINRIAYLLPIVINVFFVLVIKGVDTYFTSYENKIIIEERIKNDKKIKYEIMIDRLFEKIDINVTDEDIEEYKNNIKQKYKMEE